MNSIEIEQIEQLGGLPSVHGDESDSLFIVGASYETRTLACTRYLSKSYRAKVGMIYYNREFLQDRSSQHLQSNLRLLQEYVGMFCDDLRIVEGSGYVPQTAYLALRTAFRDLRLPSLGDETSITLDVTTWTRESLLTTVFLLRNLYPNAQIRTTYVTASKYGDWLTRGFRQVRSVIGFPGIQEPTRPQSCLFLR